MNYGRYQYYQPNEKDIKDKYGDCVIRAITKALGWPWLRVFDALQPISREMQVPFNCRPCYERFFEEQGFTYHGVSNKKGAKRPTVDTFTKEHPEGIFIARTAHHLVCIADGKYHDTWDSGRKALYGWWEK